MVKRDAMVQLKSQDDVEYPFLHIHTENGDDVDPITREVVNPVSGYDKRNKAGRMLVQMDEQVRYPEPRRIVAI